MKLTPKEKKILKATFDSCLDLKALDALLVDLRHSGTYTDWVFIASGTNDRQMRAIADRIVETIFTNCQINPLGVEGYEGAQWILVDFGSLVCHIFLAEVRETYHLEDLWPRADVLREEKIETLFNPRPRKVPIPAKKAVKRKTGGQKKAVCAKP